MGGGGWGVGGTPYNGQYKKDVPKRGNFFRLQLYERVGILLNEVYRSVRKSVISDYKKALTGVCHVFERDKKTFWFCDLSVVKRQCI